MSSSAEPDRTGVIDVIAHDARSDKIVLVMNEPFQWTGSEEQLHALQERFNAYVSFLLDGELAEAHPEMAGKSGRIEVRCAFMPEGRTLDLLGMIHDHLEFQGIELNVIVRQKGEDVKL